MLHICKGIPIKLIQNSNGRNEVLKFFLGAMTERPMYTASLSHILSQIIMRIMRTKNLTKHGRRILLNIL